MNLKDLIFSNRSYRRFVQQEAISYESLLSYVDLARNTASAGNLQPLRYLLLWENFNNEKVFPLLKWAGYLKDWEGPIEGERPAAYIIVLRDAKASGEVVNVDTGIAAQTILLAATEEGYGGCIIFNVDREKLRHIFHVPEELKIICVIALGKPAEEVRLEIVGEDNNIKYWRDESSVHHVPKRSLESIIIDNNLK